MMACEREIPYIGEYQDPKLVVQAGVCAGYNTLTCFIGRSYFFLDRQPMTAEVLDSLNITLNGTRGVYPIVKDSIAGRLHFLTLSRPIEAGDTLQLTVDHPRFGTAHAQEIVPPDFIPTSIAYEEQELTTKTRMHVVTMRLPDYPINTTVGIAGTLYMTVTNIYQQLDTLTHTYYVWDTVIHPSTSTVLLSFDPIFANSSNQYSEEEGYRSNGSGGALYFYSDYPSDRQLQVYMRSIADRTYSNGSSRTVRTDSLILEFGMASDTYVLYYASMRAYMGYQDNKDAGMDIGTLFTDMIGTEEPISIYSNVENGFGILMSKTKTRIRVK